MLYVSSLVGSGDSGRGCGESGSCVTSGDDGGETLGTNGGYKGVSGGGSGGGGSGKLSILDFTSSRHQNWNNG